MAEKKGTELAVISAEESEYTRALVAAGPDLAELLADNLGGDKLDVLSLTRIKIPSGGGRLWEIPSLDGVEALQEIEGIIVSWQTWRAYWQNQYGSGDAQPPDCSSRDGIIGTGSPGGECETCPLNEFGSIGGDKRGKACKEMRPIFYLRPDNLFPAVVMAAPMSIAPMKQYYLALAQEKRLPYWKVVTALSLEQTKNRDGITYSKIKPRFVRALSDSEIGAISTFRTTFNPVIEYVPIIRSEVDGEQEAA